MPGTKNSVSLCSFAAVGVPVGNSSASISLVFLEGNEILIMYLKTMGRKGKKNRKIILLTMSKLSSIENTI